MEVYEAMRTTFAAMVGIGRSVKQLTKLKRKPVEDFTWLDTMAGDKFDG